MRIRTIKPEFWPDRRVSSLDYFGRLFFIGLWSAADDHGRGIAEPAILAASLFPYDLARDPRDILARIARALERLAGDDRIRLYRHDGEVCFQVRNWTRHQKVDRPGKARFPEATTAEPIDPREWLATYSRGLDDGSGIRDQGSGIEGTESPPPPGKVDTAGTGAEPAEPRPGGGGGGANGRKPANPEPQADQDRRQGQGQGSDARRADPPLRNDLAAEFERFDGPRRRIMALRPSWGRPLAWDRGEMEALREAEPIIEEIEDAGAWGLLRDYLAARGGRGEQYWRPRYRCKFIESLSQVWQDANRWRDKNPPKAAPKPAPPPVEITDADREAARQAWNEIFGEDSPHRKDDPKP